MAEENPGIPFRVATNQAWSEVVQSSGTLTYQESQRRLVLAATCLRCEHQFSDSLARAYVTTGTTTDAIGGPSSEMDTVEWVARCSCSEPHPGQGPEDRGCGASFGLVLRLPKAK